MFIKSVHGIRIHIHHLERWQLRGIHRFLVHDVDRARCSVQADLCLDRSRGDRDVTQSAHRKTLCSMWIARDDDRREIRETNTVSNSTPVESREDCIWDILQVISYRTNTLRYTIIVSMSVTSIITMSLYNNLLERNLTYKVWIPFDYSSPPVFYAVYTHQLMAMSIAGIVSAACDSLFCAFLLCICCQLEILECRLARIANGQCTLRDCVLHHRRILELVLIQQL